MPPRFRAPLIVALVVVLGVVAWVLFLRSRGTPEPLPDRAPPRLEEAAGWLGPPLPSDSLAGVPSVFVVWSDTDPASPDVLHEAEGWHLAYARFGLRVIGVHAPEYSFAADSAVPARVARAAGVGFPVALDPSLTLADALGGAADAPRIEVFDRGGQLAFDGVGRGALVGAHREILRLLRAAHPDAVLPAPPPPGSGAGVDDVRTVALAVGRVSSGPLSDVSAGEPITFTAQFRYQVEGSPWVPYPVGRWAPGGEGLTAARGGAANFVAIRYDADRVDVVAGPADGHPVRLWVLRDEHWLTPASLGEDAALDERGASFVEVSEPRLYRVARGGGEHVLKLSPEEPGVTLYAFTFEWKRPTRP